MWMHDGCKVYMVSYMALNGSRFMVTWIIFKKPPLGGRSNTIPGDHDTPNAHNRWFILYYHAWVPTWIETQRYSIWSKARSHMASHSTWGSVTTLHVFGGVLGPPLDTFYWALTVSWSWLSARVWSDPHGSERHKPTATSRLGWPNPYTKFLRSKGLGIQQGTSACVGSPKSYK